MEVEHSPDPKMILWVGKYSKWSEFKKEYEDKYKMQLEKVDSLEESLETITKYIAVLRCIIFYAPALDLDSCVSTISKVHEEVDKLLHCECIVYIPKISAKDRQKWDSVYFQAGAITIVSLKALHCYLQELLSPPCPKCVRPLVVGIGGATRSGKTTLSLKLQKKFCPNTPVICQDRFFKHRMDMPVDEETGYSNWEVPESLRWDLFRLYIKELINNNTLHCSLHKPYSVGNFFQQLASKLGIKTTTTDDTDDTNATPERKIVFVEGFLLYQPQVVKLFDKKIFLCISKDTCYKRRMKTTTVPEEYFHRLLWPAYLKYTSHQLEMKDVYVIDGEAQPDVILQSAEDFINGVTPLKDWKTDFLNKQKQAEE